MPLLPTGRQSSEGEAVPHFEHHRPGRTLLFQLDTPVEEARRNTCIWSSVLVIVGVAPELG